MADASDEPRDDADAVKKPDRPLTRRPLFWIVVVVAVAGVIAAVVYYRLRVHPFETTDDAFIGADVVDIAAQVSGSVEAVPIDDNTKVEAGRLLVRIDPKPAQADLAARQADLAEAEARAEAARVGVQQADDQIAEAEAQLRSVQAEAQNAADTLRRDQALLDSDPNAISEKAVVDVRDAARAAQARAEAASRAVATARTAKKVAEADVVTAKATIKAAQSAVASAQIDLGYTTITAPVSGQIVQKSINTGSYVTMGSPVMALVPDDLYVTANFKETQLARIRIGQKVTLRVDAFPDADFHGEVVSIQQGAGQAFQLLPPQNATGNYVKVVQRVPVRISIEGADLASYPLGPGMSVVPSVRVD